MERKGRLEMRKTVSVLLMLVMLFALVGCSGGSNGGRQESEGSAGRFTGYRRSRRAAGRYQGRCTRFWLPKSDTNEVEGMKLISPRHWRKVTG